MICCNTAFEQGSLDLWRYLNAFIIIIIMRSQNAFCEMTLNQVNQQGWGDILMTSPPYATYSVYQIPSCRVHLYRCSCLVACRSTLSRSAWLVRGYTTGCRHWHCPSRPTDTRWPWTWGCCGGGHSGWGGGRAGPRPTATNPSSGRLVSCCLR